jgi:integrase
VNGKVRPRGNNGGSAPLRGYAPWHPHPKTLPLLEQLGEVLAEYEAYLPLTIRQVFYRLVGVHDYEKSERAYARLLYALDRARRAELVPFEALRDDGIVVMRSEWYGEPADFWDDVARQAHEFSLHKQFGQRAFIELWCEAAGMMPQLRRVADRYSVEVYSCGGSASLTAVRGIVRRVVKRNVPTVLLHVGDFDPDGEAAFRAMTEDAAGFLERDAQGKQRRRKVDGGLMAARKALTTERGKRDRGERTATDPRLTFNVAADAWLEARVARLRPNTQASYRGHLVHLRARWGRTRLGAITPAEVGAYVAEIEREGSAGWTARGRLSVLSGVMTYAGRHLGHVGVNPVSLLDRVERPSTDDERVHVIVTTDEVASLVAHAGRHRLLLATAAQTGARKAEVLGLTWADIDVAGRTVAIERQLDRDGGRQPLKTKRSARTIAIGGGLASDLAAARLARGAAADEFVFLTGARAAYGHSSADYALRAACKAAGLAPAPTWHDLRHSHASMLIAAGHDPVAVAARLGDTVAVVLSTYAHEYDAARRRSDESDGLDAAYGGSAVAAPAATTRPSVGPDAPSNVAQLRRSGPA